MGGTESKPNTPVAEAAVPVAQISDAQLQAAEAEFYAKAHKEGYESAYDALSKMVPTQVQSLLEDKLSAVEAAHAKKVEAAVETASSSLKRAPIRDAPCSEERARVAECYKTSSTPLKCQDVVQAYASCAKQSSRHLLEGR